MPYKWTEIPAGEWLPDQARLNNPGSIQVENCVAYSGGYKPFTAAIAFSVVTTTAADDHIRGAAGAIDNSLTTHTYAGDAKDIYELSATGWDVVSSAAAAYSGTATTESWRFDQWGNQIMATNFNNEIQRKYMESGTFNTLNNATGATGNAPRARHMKRVRDFMVTGNIVDNATSIAYPSRVQWSGYNNNLWWTPSVQEQADYQDMLDGGQITGFVGGDYGVVFQTDQITLMSYVGPPLIFRFDTVEQFRGCKIPGSIVRYGERIFYLGDDDFYEFTLQGSRSLGANRMAQFFYNDVQQTAPERLSGFPDITQKRILWSYPSLNATGTRPDRTICLDLNTMRFTYIKAGYSKLFGAFGSGYTIETLDNLQSSIDDLVLSLDDPFYAGGRPKLGGFIYESAGWKLAFFEGDPLTGSFETTEIRAQPGQSIEVDNTRPLIENGTGKVQVGTRSTLEATVTWSNVTQINKYGEANLRANSPFMRFRVETSGNYTLFTGVDAKLRGSGNR